MEEMTIKEIKAQKKKVEDQILGLITDFEKKTGVEVEEIELDDFMVLFGQKCTVNLRINIGT